MTEALEIETLLRGLLKGEFSHLSLSFNDDAGGNYRTVEQGILEYEELHDDDDPRGDWTSPEERQLAIDNNSHWVLYFYPHTPVGFYKVEASTLTAIIEYLKRETFL